MKKINFKKPVKGWKRLSKKKKVITSSIAVVMVCVITGSVIFIQKGKGDELPQNVTQQATVMIGNISNTIVGTGTLETDASDSITVPTGIIVKEIKVESGDAVSKGDTLATVDKTSVLEAIETVQEEIEALDEKINECKDSDETQTITAKVSGKIKKIYAKKGDSVTECIAEEGALMVLAVDGDTDEKIEITASGGTVSEVHVSKNQSVSAGDTLLTIKKDEESTEYKKLLSQRKELTSSLKKLTAMSQSGTIVADIDGTVGDVNVSEGSESSVGGTANSSSTSSSSSSGKAVSASQMSYKSETSSGSSMVTLSTNSKSNAGVSLTTLSTNSNVATTSDIATTAALSDSTKLQLKITNSGSSTKSSLAVALPKTGNTPQNEIHCTDGSYEGKISWNPNDSAFQGETTYSADVTLYAAEGFVFGSDSIIQVQTGILSGTTVSEDGKTIAFHITFPATVEEKQTQDNEQKETTKSIDNNKQQETVENKSENNSNGGGNINGNNELNSNNTGNNSYSSSGARSGSVTSGTLTVASGTQSTSSTSSNESTSYSNEVTAFTLAPNDSMVLSVNVDELDINSVSKGQEAKITLDAIEDKTFTGTVTKVANSASSSGSGVAKYIVKINIPKDEQMKSGMNASATIVVENKENILTIPVNALQERGDKTFVYTEQDAEGNLSGEMEVTTGLSDGDNVEITEGLSEGDTVYYQKTGKTSNQSSSGAYGGNKQGEFGNRGEKPEGFGGRGGSGDMPAGRPGEGGM